MKDMDKLRERFLHDPLPRRLGGIAATLGRISSSARKSNDPKVVSRLLDEAKHLIEWTAADAEPEAAAELVRMQTMITLWERAWEEASQSPRQRLLLSVQAKDWSDKTLGFSGLVYAIVPLADLINYQIGTPNIVTCFPSRNAPANHRIL